MEIKEKKVRTLVEEEYLISIVDKEYKYTDFADESGKFTSWSLVDDKNNNVIADEPQIIQIVAALQNAVDRYNNRTPRHQETHNEQQDVDHDSSGDSGADQNND